MLGDIGEKLEEGHLILRHFLADSVEQIIYPVDEVDLPLDMVIIEFILKFLSLHLIVRKEIDLL